MGQVRVLADSGESRMGAILSILIQFLTISRNLARSKLVDPPIIMSVCRGARQEGVKARSHVI